MENVVIVSGVRTPIGAYGGSLRNLHVSRLGALVLKEAVERKKQKGDIKLIWLQEGIINDEAEALAEAKGIEFIQDKCMYKEYMNK